MDCRIFEKQIDSLLEKEIKDEGARLDDGLRQHLHTCSKCRDKYAAISNDDISEQTISEPPKVHVSEPSNEKASDQLFAPVEFKDAPISFTMHVNGREEAVKVVEPEMDLPLPEEGRLVVKKNEAVWCDVKFTFNPDSDRPYKLYFSVLKGRTHTTDYLMAFGKPIEEDKDLLNQYKMKIADRGGVKARIEMTRGKARLAIKYKRETQRKKNAILS